MPTPRPPRLDRILERLEAQHGPPGRDLPRTPLQWILWENVAYLVDDERRARAFAALKKAAGLTAESIEAAPLAKLQAVTRLGGMHPEARADRLKDIATLAREHGGRGLESVLALPLPAARKVLRAFPSIGAPGAAKILLACGSSSELALESNGLRVLLRLGRGREEKDYAATYRSVITSVAGELEPDATRVWRAHRLLRTHGQQVCRSRAPECDSCALADVCPSAS